MTSKRAIAALFFCLSFTAGAGAQTKAKPAPARPRQTEQRADPLAALLQQADSAIDKKDYAAAVQALASYLAQRPDDPAAHFQLGYAYSGLERWDEAKSEYVRAIALNPKLAEAHLNLGLLLLERNPSAAIEPFQHAAELLPSQARPRFLLGLACERSGSVVAAIEQYQSAEKLDAKNFDVRFALGRSLLRAGRASEAETQFREALELRSDYAPAHLGLANSLQAQKKLEPAADELAAYLLFKPDDREARLERASILADLGRHDQAMEELERSDAGAWASLESWKLRAEIYLRQKRWDQAAETLQKALQSAPQDAELHARLGRIWLEKRDFVPAERELLRALQINPNWTDALRDLVAVNYLAGNYPAALDGLDRLGKREELGPGSWFIRATCYDKLDRKPEALAAYEKFLALDQRRNENQEWQAQQRIKLLTRELQQKKR